MNVPEPQSGQWILLGVGFANAAYDSGKVFVVNNAGLMTAFDAATGNLLWSVRSPKSI